ncbi:MAG: HNH endonuclease [Alphaproteobacteria bacterium]|uniref:HNH endonuclease n=1 Tax=Candidatus Nitrobium versatile TaxID=2884831 RepID=A0A953J3S7_9BACT|nr:HNH endonuclease [Candidatus Nitrobium versatile]
MMQFVPEATEREIRREKSVARELRKSSWWRRKCAGGACYYCRSKVPPGELTMDHLVPLVRGGRSVKSNIVAACKECNNKKKYLIPLEWEEYLSGLDREDR